MILLLINIFSTFVSSFGGKPQKFYRGKIRKYEGEREYQKIRFRLFKRHLYQIGMRNLCQW